MPINSDLLWVFLKGDPVSVLQGGQYGSLGIPASNNKPGSRAASMTMMDQNGRLYLFGGGTQQSPNNNQFNDLWRFDPTTNNWVWVKGHNFLNSSGHYGTMGVTDPANTPSARSYGVAWSAPSGLLYVFGGHGYDAFGQIGYLNDLWQYNPIDNNWTWLKGDQNKDQPAVTIGPPINHKPGARQQAVGWVSKNGTLYLFAGSQQSNSYNDLWRYTPSTNIWDVLQGDPFSPLGGQTPHYGNTPSPLNTPGSRTLSISWTDQQDRFYLFGGLAGGGARNDLWRYNLSDGYWVWLSGSNGTDQQGIYGSQGIETVGSTPGARHSATGWVDESDRLFLFGGSTNSSLGLLNDVWMYNPNTNGWTWVKGSQTGGGTTAVYGTQGIPNLNNTPQTRVWPVSWGKKLGSAYLFGGFQGGEPLNDLWQLTFPCNITLSDIGTFPTTVSSGQPFNLTWRLVPTPYPLNYQAVVTFKGSDYSDNFTTLTGSIALPAQPVGIYSDIKLRLKAISIPKCSDMRSVSVTIFDPALLPVFLSYLPSLIIALLILYLSMIAFFLYDTNS